MSKENKINIYCINSVFYVKSHKETKKQKFFQIIYCKLLTIVF